MTSPETQNIKVLVVDDDSFTRDILEEILESNGYLVKTAENGLEALEKYAADPEIILIISDMNMPEMNGLEFIRELRGKETDVPVIILTGNDEISVAIESMKSGANDYILKDENIQETIFLSAENVLEKQRLKEQNKKMTAELALRNKELEQTNRELVELNNLKNKFLGIAAHDLRNPLASISGLSEMILNGSLGPLAEDQGEYMTTINTAAEGMLALVNDLLDVSVIESGKLDLQMQSGSLKDVIEERIRIQRTVAGQKDIVIHEALSQMAHTLFDPNRISQVIDNLISNAIKFSPSGSNIYVAIDQEGALIKVSVRDEGPGISPEEQSVLFAEFQRGSIKPTAGEKSTGLGLAIVKKIIEAHHGSLEINSEVGQGATFSFKLPMGATEQAVTDTHDSRIEKKIESPTQKLAVAKRPLSILLVEDAEENQFVIQAYLKDTPHSIDIAENGQIGVEKITSRTYDLVLMDIQMPVMDGYEATRKIRKWEPENNKSPVPIIALSAHTAQEYILKCRDAGCNDYLGKPIKKDNLLKLIAEYSGT